MSSTNDSFKVKKKTIVTIIIWVIILSVIAYLVWIYKPSHITVLYLLVAWFGFRSYAEQWENNKLRKRIERLEKYLMGK